MSIGNEYTEVEKPLLDQLHGLGWTVIEASNSDASTTGRSDFREIVLEERLGAAMIDINRDRDGDTWLDDARLNQAIGHLLKPGVGVTKLLDVNELLTGLLLEGVSVEGLAGWNQGRDQRVNFIDFDHPENNDFLAVSQYRVDEPGGQGKKYIAPDVVLFVNGIPLVVIECKSPYIREPMAEGIKQLRRYANQRGGLPEGNERLFWTNQFVVSTYGDQARVGTFTSGPEHFMEWRDPWPKTRAALATDLGKQEDQLSGQEVLVAGMLTPAHLLDIARHFTLFNEAGGRRFKLVARFQQYRAVQKALVRLSEGKTRLQDGEFDRRGGVVWHTQGSGKSLTMVFLVRAMRSDPDLRAFKVVVVTDRTDLEKQLSKTAALSGEVVKRATKSSRLKELLRSHGPGLVFAMIQKYRDSDSVSSNSGVLEEDTASATIFDTLNTDDSIVILVDEAHRSQTSTLHANLMAALPNAAKIGFTGTPIMRDGKRKTAAIFGTEIDRYTIREAETDGAVVPIFYEGKTAKGAVAGASSLDELFEDIFGGQTEEQLEALKSRYATTGSVLEAPLLIGAKAHSMFWHYVSAIMPGGFKAQVTATSRLGAVRYRDALLAARDAFVLLAEDLPPATVASYEAGSLDVDGLDRQTQVLVRAQPHLDMIRLLEFVPVISGTNNDPPEWLPWTEKSKQEQVIENLKKDLGPPGEKTSPVAFVLVKSMLLTGFDAPNLQVQYIDRKLQDADLLQAIARVNRTADGKSAGHVVDYYGVGAHLKEALTAYAPEDEGDSIGALTSILDLIPLLRDGRDRLLAIFAQAGINHFDTEEDLEACVEVLRDEALRMRFGVLLGRFFTTFNNVLPRSEALPYVWIVKRLGLIQKLARRRYRDDGLDGFDPSLYGEKVRKLIDEHVLALDIASKVPPVSITDPQFVAKVQGFGSDRAMASEMEHAIRFHIRQNFDQDPARYQRLSERLEEILKGLASKWDQLALALSELVDDMNAGVDQPSVHLDPIVVRVYGVLADEFDEERELRDEVRQHLLGVSESIVNTVVARASIVRFWSNTIAQESLRHELIQLLDDSDLFTFEAQPAMADHLMELASANRQLIAERLRKEGAM